MDVVAHPGVLAGFIRENHWSQMRRLERVCKYTLISIDFHNAHWVTAVVVQNPGNPSRPSVQFFDPLGGSPEKRRLIRRVLRMTGIYLDPVVGDLSRWVQIDDFTCGSWMVAATRATSRRSIMPAANEVRPLTPWRMSR